MHQRKYCLELISDMGLSSSKSIDFSVELNQKLTTAEFDLHFPQEKLFGEPEIYQRLLYNDNARHCICSATTKSINAKPQDIPHECSVKGWWNMSNSQHD